PARARGAPRGSQPGTGALRVPGGAGAGFDEVDAVYATALRRTQLRLALGTVAGFVVVMVAVTVAIVLIPELGVVSVGGVPLSWLLHAFAFYPVIVLFPVLYTRAAARNERRYLALRERE
ncbi:heavy metal transporter, partial [Microbacterium lacticum]|uniref:heavy metal transporter n=1 Tax=Microbacterium lacticum TaxID=33885 RepID=UPI003A87D88B